MLPPWSSDQEFLATEIPGSILGATRFFWEVVDLERGPLSLVRITEQLLQWKSSGSGSRELRLTAVGISCADHATPSIRKKLALTSPTTCGRSVSTVRLRPKATEFSLLKLLLTYYSTVQ
jgi:hypothetical protein